MLFNNWEYLSNVVHVLLSRTDLLSLLAKLDGNPPDSACSIFRNGGDGEPSLVVTAQEDAQHVRDGGLQGRIHPSTLDAIEKFKDGRRMTAVSFPPSELEA